MRALASSTLFLLACGSQPVVTSPQPAAPPAEHAPTTSIGMAPITTGRFGANVTPGGVVFRVWAPHATSASVVGDFAEHTVPMSLESEGVFAVTVQDAHAGNQYTFAFETPYGNLTRVDPYCRQLLVGSTGCVVVDPSAYTWKNPTFARPARNATVVYELHLASFSVPANAPNGTFASVAAALPSVQDLGANAIEVMPIQSYGSKAPTWGYNPQLFFAPRPELGGSDDLRGLVDTAHGLGVGVWMDTVVNHMDRLEPRAARVLRRRLSERDRTASTSSSPVPTP